MIRALIAYIVASKNRIESFKQRLSKSSVLIRLYITSLLFRRKNTKSNVSFLGYTVWGYSYYSLYFLFKEVFITNEYFFIASTSSPVIIDCGANIGMSVLYFKKLYPSASIIAFEANQHVYRLLEENIRTNKLTDVELHNVALYDEETEISFFIDNNIGSFLGSVREDRGGNREMRISTQKLSAYLKNIPSVDLIKIDVEGAEIQILNDLFHTSMIGKAKEYIIEYHHN